MTDLMWIVLSFALLFGSPVIVIGLWILISEFHRRADTGDIERKEMASRALIGTALLGMMGDDFDQ